MKQKLEESEKLSRDIHFPTEATSSVKAVKPRKEEQGPFSSKIEQMTEWGIYVTYAQWNITWPLENMESYNFLYVCESEKYQLSEVSQREREEQT